MSLSLSVGKQCSESMSPVASPHIHTHSPTNRSTSTVDKRHGVQTSTVDKRHWVQNSWTQKNSRH